MLEDIATTTRPAKKVKVLAASQDTTDEDFFIDSTISFRPFINYLKEKLAGCCDSRSRIYKDLIEKLEAEPALLQPWKIITC